MYTVVGIFLTHFLLINYKNVCNNVLTYNSLAILTNFIILIDNCSHVEFVFVALTDAIGPQQFFVNY